MPLQLNLVDIKGVAIFANELERPQGFNLAAEIPHIRVIDAATGETIAGVKKAGVLDGLVYRRDIGAPPNPDGTPAYITEWLRPIRIEWTPPTER